MTAGTKYPPEKVAAIVEDVAFLLSWGEHPAHIAARLGMTTMALEQFLRVRGRHDLARPFYTERGLG